MRLIVGGAYFTDNRLEFFPQDHPYRIEKYDWRELLHPHRKEILTEPYFVFGIKSWVRKLKKQRLNWNAIADRICAHLTPNIPMGILDDCNLADELHVADRLRKRLFMDFDCRIYLLREYLSIKQYDRRVIPFSIPCKDNTALAIPNREKKVNICFYGNKSHKDRRKILKQLKGAKTNIHLYDNGEKSPSKKPRRIFLLDMAEARICPVFAGAGYCTFRYQEVPSVGSIIAVPRYPWIVRNDYVDRVSCIKFDKPQEVLNILTEPQQLEDIQQASIEHFKKYHTVGVRYKEFTEYAGEICRN